MAQFYGEIQGSRGKASRLGTKASGIWCHVRGWTVGVRVDGWHRVSDGGDVFPIYVTGGSNGETPDIYLGHVTMVDGRPTFIADTEC